VKQLLPFSSIDDLRASVEIFNEPSAESLGRAVLSLLMFAESLICIFWIFTLSSLGEAYAFMAAVPYVYIIFSYISLLVFYRLKQFDYIIFTQLIMLLVMPFFMQWLIGGFAASSGVAIWALLSPVGALMILGARQSSPWFMLFMALAVVSWQLNSVFASNALPIPMRLKDDFFVINLLGFSTVMYVAMRYFQSQKAKVLEALAAEKARSERLLLSIFPGSVAERLKNNDLRIADHYDSATIMFADLVDFTGLSADMPPSALVDLLNQVFSKFDELANTHKLEKIKTIGDSYMVVGGVPVSRHDHATAIANMALEIQQVLNEVSAKTGKNLSMRIGIHSGPVVAGVIGTSKFSYDLWGDAVNLASRMEQFGIPGEIQTTEATYALLSKQFEFEARGSIAIKGKGKVQAYLLKARKHALNA